MLKIKSLTSCNINGIPLKSVNLSKRMFEYKSYINENVNLINDSEFVVLTINGLYGYRVGILGWLSTYLSHCLSQVNNPLCIKSIFDNVIANDYEVISHYISLVSRSIPLFNYGNWDYKNYLFTNNILKTTSNLSIPKIYDLLSIYTLKPLFDSGSAIYSNKISHDSGFERWKIWDMLNSTEQQFNKGIIWSYFISENNKNGIMIITMELIEDRLVLEQLKQLVDMKEFLELKFKIDVEKYETYIIGDFKTQFNMGISEDVKNKLDILVKSNLKFIENSNDIMETNFIFYSNSDIIVNNITKFSVEEDQIINVDFCTKTENTSNEINKLQEIIIMEEPNTLEEIIVTKETNTNEEITNKLEEININEINIRDDYFSKQDENINPLHIKSINEPEPDSDSDSNSDKNEWLSI